MSITDRPVNPDPIEWVARGTYDQEKSRRHYAEERVKDLQLHLDGTYRISSRDKELVARGLRVASHSTPLFDVRECAAMREIANRLDPDGAM